MANYGRLIALAPEGLVEGRLDFSNSPNAQRLDNSSEMIGFKFYSRDSVTMTDLDVYLNVQGTVTDATFTIEINGDSSDTPDGTPVGSVSSGWSGPASSGWLGLKSIGSAALTRNTPYWIVIKCTVAGSVGTSNYIQFKQAGNLYRPNGEKTRHHNGTNWTTTSVDNKVAIVVLKDNGSKYRGLPLSGGIGRSSQTDIFTTNRQGLMFQCGSLVRIPAVQIRVTKSGTPNDLVVHVFESSSEKYSQTIAAAQIVSGVDFICYFASPVFLAANTLNFITLDQASGGGSDSNDYDVHTYPINLTYVDAIMPGINYRFISGNQSDPNNLTPQSSEIPVIIPFVDILDDDFDETAVAGGSHFYICE